MRRKRLLLTAALLIGLLAILVISTGGGGILNTFGMHGSREAAPLAPAPPGNDVPSGEVDLSARTVFLEGRTTAFGHMPFVYTARFTPAADMVNSDVSALAGDALPELPLDVLLTAFHPEGFASNGEAHLSLVDWLDELPFNQVDGNEGVSDLQREIPGMPLVTPVAHPGLEGYVPSPHRLALMRPHLVGPGDPVSALPGGWAPQILPDVSLPDAGADDVSPYAPSRRDTQPQDGPPNKVPEPETFFLLGAGLVCLAVYLALRKRQRR